MIHTIAFIEHGHSLIIAPDEARKLKAKPQQILWINKHTYSIIPIEVVNKEIERVCTVDELQASDCSALCFHSIDAIEIPKAMSISHSTAKTNGRLKDAVPFAIDHSKLEARIWAAKKPFVLQDHKLFTEASPHAQHVQTKPEVKHNIHMRPRGYVLPLQPLPLHKPIKQSKRYIPDKVYLMCKTGALLVGSYARFVLNKADSYNDFDLIVPPDKWYAVSLLITKDAKVNNHGGWKFQDNEGHTIDVWPCSIDQHLRQCKPGLGKQEYIVDYINSKVYTAYSVGIKHEK